MFSVTGCVAKSEHAKLLEEKVAVEKKYDDLLSKRSGLRDEIAARQDEVKALRSELIQAKSKISDLDKEMARLKNPSQDLSK